MCAYARDHRPLTGLSGYLHLAVGSRRGDIVMLNQDQE